MVDEWTQARLVTPFGTQNCNQITSDTPNSPSLSRPSYKHDLYARFLPLARALREPVAAPTFLDSCRERNHPMLCSPIFRITTAFPS